MVEQYGRSRALAEPLTNPRSRTRHGGRSGPGRLTEPATHGSPQFAFEPPRSAHRYRVYKVRAPQGRQELQNSGPTKSRETSMPYFAVYAPDYTDEGALERRLKVREQHLANAHKESRMSTLLLSYQARGTMLM